MPNIAAAALLSRSTCGLRFVSSTPRIMRPQAHAQAQVEDRVLQRHTTLRDEEPVNGRLREFGLAAVMRNYQKRTPKPETSESSRICVAAPRTPSCWDHLIADARGPPVPA